MIEVTYSAHLTRPVNQDVVNVSVIRYEVVRVMDDDGSEYIAETQGYVLQMEPMRWEPFDEYAPMKPTLQFTGILSAKDGHLAFKGMEDDLK